MMTEETKIELGAAQPPVKVSKKRGRKPKNQAMRIRELLKAGFTTKQIAAKVGCDPQRVYVVRHNDKKRAEAAQARVKELVSTRIRPTTITLHQADERVATPREAKAQRPAPVPTPTPTFWQRVKAVFFPN
jgi:hypothetical protein